MVARLLFLAESVGLGDRRVLVVRFRLLGWYFQAFMKGGYDLEPIACSLAIRVI